MIEVLKKLYNSDNSQQEMKLDPNLTNQNPILREALYSQVETMEKCEMQEEAKQNANISQAEYDTVIINKKPLCKKDPLLHVRCIPLSPGGRMHFMNYQLVRYIPYFSLTNLIEFLLLERRKIWISNIYLPNILNLWPRTMGKYRIKKSNQTA